MNANKGGSIVKIIAGLGNPGIKYENTPHSIGFEVVDAFASGHGAVFEYKRAFDALVAKVQTTSGPVTLVKPQTFMNLSGDSVAPLVKYSNATAADLIVVQDDIDLPLGRIRIRMGGSCGGHNGIRNIIERLGTQSFLRLKIGVGKDRDDVIGFVLGKFTPESRKTADESVKEAVAALDAILSDGADRAMNAFNSRRAGS